MRDSIHLARLTRSRRAHLLAVALPLSAVLVAGCTGGSGHPAPATTRATASALSAASDCFLPPAACYTQSQFRVAYGIQPLLDRGIDGQGETITDLETAVPVNAPPGSTIIQAGPTSTATIHVTGPSGQPPAVTGIRQDLARFDSLFRLPAARIQIVTSLAGSASPWQASSGEVGDLEELHMVAPAATLRVVLMPASVQNSAKTATAGLLAGLRVAVSGTDVGTLPSESTVKEVSLPASDPFVLAVGGTTLTANPSTGAYIRETVWNTSTDFVSPGEASGGGFSHLYARPSYQDGVPGTGAMRGVPDVAAPATTRRFTILLVVTTT